MLTISTATWNICTDFAYKAKTVITPTALVSSICIIALTILSGHPVTVATITFSTVVGCSLSTIKLLHQRKMFETSPTFIKKTLNCITSREFLIGTIVGVGSCAALIAATGPKCYFSKEVHLRNLTPEQLESSCCREIDEIRDRVRQGSVVIKSGPRI